MFNIFNEARHLENTEIEIIKSVISLFSHSRDKFNLQMSECDL